MALFFSYLCYMNSLLLILDETNAKHYIPADNIQRIYRVDAVTTRIQTNIVLSVGAVGSPSELACYDFGERPPGLGVSDTTQVEAFITAWQRALSGSSTTISVSLPGAVFSVTPTSQTWT